MPYLIRTQTGGAAEERFTLKIGPNLVGRSKENDIVVLHNSISRQHARLDVDAERVVMTDLNSRNGTSVDGLRVQRCRLKNSDVVQFGEVYFRFEDEREAERARAAQRAAAMDISGLLSTGEEGRTTALRIRTVQPERRAEEKLRLLLTVSQYLSSPSSIEKLLPRVFDFLFQILEVDRAALLLVSEETGQLEPCIVRTNRGPAGPDPIYSQQIVDHVFQKGTSVLAGDALIDPRFKKTGSIVANSIRAAMCVPLKARDTLSGVLYVDCSSVPNRYGEEDLEFLEAFATEAAVAVENSRLAKRLEAEAVTRSSLLRFFPPSVVGPLMSSPDFGREVRDCEITVLFSDISGFTAMSSKLQPRQVISLLNHYFPVMADIVFRHNGTLEKYIGDALMAIWGVPEPQPDDADRALETAFEMMSALEKFNAELAGLPPLSIHIGLNSGPVAFGNIGSDQYVQFAAIGDTTNVASRMCSLAGAGEIVLSAATADRLTRPCGTLDALPPAHVKGKDEAMTVYRATPPRPSVEETYIKV